MVHHEKFLSLARSAEIFFGTLLGFSISELGSVPPAAHGGPRGWEVRASSTKTTACVSLLKQAVPKPLLRKQYLTSLLRYQSTSAASESVAKTPSTAFHGTARSCFDFYCFDFYPGLECRSKQEAGLSHKEDGKVTSESDLY